MSQPTNLVGVLNQAAPPDQSVYESTASQKTRLGTRLTLSDRVFRYALAATNLAAGKVVCAPAPTASHQSGLFSISAAGIGDKVIFGTSSAAVAANYYAEGYFGSTAGNMFRIKSNDAGSTGFRITLYDGLQTAIASSAAVFLYPNPYSNVFIGSENLDVPIGVVPCTVTSGEYFWLQTWGPAAPLHVGATPAGVALSLGTTGGITAFLVSSTAANNSVMPIGKNSPLAATAGQANPVYLTITP